MASKEYLNYFTCRCFYQLLYKDILLYILDLTAVPEYFLYPLCLLSLEHRAGILRMISRRHYQLFSHQFSLKGADGSMNHFSQISGDMCFSLPFVWMVMHISCTFNGLNPFVMRRVGAGSSASAGTWLSPVLWWWNARDLSPPKWSQVVLNSSLGMIFFSLVLALSLCCTPFGRGRSFTGTLKRQDESWILVLCLCVWHVKPRSKVFPTALTSTECP